VPRTPQKEAGSRSYEEGWRAINELIRAGGSWSGRERNVCYRNRGDGSFEDVSYVTGLDFPQDGRAWVWLDLDADGDLDLVLQSRNEPRVRVLRNELSGHGTGLLVHLEGVKSNRDAIGARVRLITAAGSRMREVHSGAGFLSQSSRRAHFGIRPGETVEALEIEWPSGRKERLAAPPVRGWIRVKEGEGRWEPFQPVSRIAPPPPDDTLSEQPWLTGPVPLPDSRLASYRGKKVLLTLSASWCPPCMAEIKELAANRGKLSAGGLQVVTLALDDNPKAAAANPFPKLMADERMVGVYTVLYRYLFDWRRDLALPLSLLLDENGAVVKLYQGAVATATLLSDLSTRRRPTLPFPGRRYTESPLRNYTELATAMAERGFLAEAGLLFRAARDHGQGGGGYELLNNYAGMLVGQGKPAEAEPLLRAAIQDNPKQAAPQRNLGLLLLEANKWREAAKWLEKALALQPDDPKTRRALSSAYNDIGIASMEAGRKSDGLAAFEKARSADPDDPAGAINLALHHSREGNRALARQLLEKFLTSHPDADGVKRALGQLP